MQPRVRRWRELPDLISHTDVNVESAQDVQLVVEYREATRQNAAPCARPRSGNGGKAVSDRVIAEYACCGRGRSSCGAAYAVDVWRPGVGEHAARHVAHLVVWISGRLGGPGVGGWIVFKRVSELAACCVGGAAAHAVKLPVGREINANSPHCLAGQIGTWGPGGRAQSRRRMIRQIDRRGKGDNHA